MARPKSDTVEYFPMMAAPSRVIQNLEGKYGNDGFAFYYKLLQILATEDGHFFDCRNPIDMEFLSRKCGVDMVSSEKMLSDLCLWRVLNEKLWERKIIWIQSFVDSLEDVYRTRRRAAPCVSIVYEKTGVYSEINDNSSSFLRENYTKNALISEESTQSKVKESKENPPHRGDSAAAASSRFPGSQKPEDENLEALAILDELEKIRGNVDKPDPWRANLLIALKKDSRELDMWKNEIQRHYQKITIESQAKIEADKKVKRDMAERLSFESSATAKTEVLSLKQSNPKAYFELEKKAHMELHTSFSESGESPPENIIPAMIKTRMYRIWKDMKEEENAA